MSQKSLHIFYNEIESKITINLEKINTYELFMVKIRSLICDYDSSKTYHIMAINTSKPNILLDEDNYMTIMTEKLEEDDLKLFLDKIDINLEENSDDFQYQYINNSPISQEINDIKINEDERKKNMFLEKNNNNDNNNDNNNEDNISDEYDEEEIQKQLKIDQNIKNDINKIINDDNEDIFRENNFIFNKIDNVLEQKNFNTFKKINSEDKHIIFSNKVSNSIYDNNNDNYFLLRDNDINEYNMNNFDENDEIPLNSNLIKKDTFEILNCSLCKNSLLDVKYICCVCERCILCHNCELKHFHPCFKFKSQFLSNLSDIYKFISKLYSFKKPSNNFFSKMFKKEYEIKMIPLSDKKICLRPKREYFFPIKIVNLTKEVIDSSKFQIIPKDNKLVQIYYDNYKKLNINPNSNIIIKMKCISGEKLGKEVVNFYGFSEHLDFKNKKELNFSIYFEINDDIEEENFNKNLEYNENVILYTKEHKEMALKILDNIGDYNRSKEHINQVFNILIKFNWNQEKAIKQIKLLKFK